MPLLWRRDQKSGLRYLPFHFKGLASKIYVAFLLAAAVPTSVAGLVGIFYSLDTLKRETLLHLEKEAVGRAKAMTLFFEQLSSELRYLAAAPSLNELAASGDADGRPRGVIQARIQRDFAAFARTYPYIYQIRYLDAAGREVVRIDRREDRIYVVPDAELQDKSDRYYVQETLAVEGGEIYVSPLDLNVERGEAESPERPVVRFGTPIHAKGELRGLLIINLHAGVILDYIQEMAEARAGTVYLFSRSGFYLARSPDPASHHAFEMKSLEELTTTFSRALLGRILAGNAGTAEQGEWIVAYAPVKVKSISESTRQPMEWAVVQAFPRRELFAAIFNLFILYGVLAVALGVTAAAGILLSRYLLRHLTVLSAETEKIADGNFASRVEIKGNDEIAGLGTRFNQMAERLEQTYASLQRQRDNLEAEVQARTAALDRERRNLVAVIQNTADGILSVSKTGEVDLANAAASQLLAGDKTIELLGQPVGRFWPRWPQAISGLEENGPRLVSFEKEGRTLELSLAPVLRDKVPQGFIVVVRDVSEERRLQDERRELDRQIFQMEKMTSLGELAMGLAHEIGNPLAGMKTVVQALLEDMAEHERAHMYLERVENEIDRLATFLRTFHGFAAPQEMHPVRCRLEDVLEDVLLWTRKEAKSKGISIEYKRCSAAVPALWADPNQLKQVLLNLVMNAIHAMELGGRITIGMCGPFPGEGWPNAVSRIRFCVEDTGPGIPQDILPRIFDPFFTTRPDGSGLGLAVVRKIALQHGADIHVESSAGSGARFEFAWPIADLEGAFETETVPPCDRS